MTDYIIYATWTCGIDGRTIKAGKTVERSFSESYIVNRCIELQEKGFPVAWESREYRNF